MENQLDSTGEESGIGDDAHLDVEQTSAPFVGRWSQLISQTNWEKGRIIYQWREALADSGASPAAFADDEWAQRVGGVTPQHVGRLRRVYHRFGETQSKFEGLFWSHFQIAIDWEDAEMWLEGSVQNGWSVAQMRKTRAETLELDDIEEMEPVSVTVDIDEDFVSGSPNLNDGINTADVPAAASVVDDTVRRGSVNELDDDELPFEADEAAEESETPVSIRPFESVGELPADLEEALSAFKLAVLRHKASDWSEVRPDQVLAALGALQTLVTSP